MIYHLNEGGTMACVAPHGVLFRGNAEGVIRRFLIEKRTILMPSSDCQPTSSMEQASLPASL